MHYSQDCLSMNIGKPLSTEPGTDIRTAILKTSLTFSPPPTLDSQPPKIAMCLLVLG